MSFKINGSHTAKTVSFRRQRVFLRRSGFTTGTGCFYTYQDPSISSLFVQYATHNWCQELPDRNKGENLEETLVQLQQLPLKFKRSMTYRSDDFAQIFGPDGIKHHSKTDGPDNGRADALEDSSND